MAARRLTAKTARKRKRLRNKQRIGALSAEGTRKQRSDWDSNPGGVAPHTLSRRAPSATRTSLRGEKDDTTIKGLRQDSKLAREGVVSRASGFSPWHPDTLHTRTTPPPNPQTHAR